MKVKNLLWITLLGIFFSVAVQAQPAPTEETSVAPGGTITGHVYSKIQRVPMEYASVALYNASDSTMVTGGITETNGSFRFKGIKKGNYYMLVSFMGFKVHKVPNIKIDNNNRHIQLPTIYLESTTNTLKDVEVKAQQSMVSYQMDKKVVNVSQDLMASSGSAIDVLENVPSVDVDLEGNVSIRGSSSFTVLIDGRPSILDGNDALQQIPASSIERIEIITNPSAKYDPEGVGGIINIVLKKEKRDGLNGVATASVSTRDKYRGSLLLAYRKGKVNYHISVDGNNRNYHMNVNSDYHTLNTDTTGYRISMIDGTRIRKGYGVRGGVDFYFNDKSTLFLQARIGNYGFGHDNNSKQHLFTDPMTMDNYYNSVSHSNRWGHYYSAQADFLHKFNDLGHQIEALVYVSKRASDDTETQTDYTTNADWVQTSGMPDRIQSTTMDTATQLRIKVDYSLPVGEKGKFEAGYQSRFRFHTGNYDFQNFDTLTNQWVYNPDRSSTISFDRNIHAAYASFKNTWGKLGYEAGLRTEYTDRRVNNSTATGIFKIQRFDFFPSAYLSYQFKYNYQIYASYTRRIDRPHGWDLNPFPRVIDPYNIRVGNPELEPEYINSYELGVQKAFAKSFVSLEGYYREGKNIITRVQTLGPDGILYHTNANLNNDHSLGVEMMTNLKPNNWLNLNLTGNLYHYRLEGNVTGENVSAKSTNWSLRGTITVNMKKNLRVQWRGMYRSPTVTIQGSRKGFFFNNLALRKDFFDRKLNVTLSARDLFGTAKFDFISQGTGFYTHTVMQREWPIISINVNYIINNYKQKRQRQLNDDNQENNSEGIGF